MTDNLRHIPPNDNEVSAKPDLEALLQQSGGIERASPELVEGIRRDRGPRTRQLVIAEPGSDREKLLDYFGAEASTDMGNPNHITARQNPSKAVLLEEYLHGVQINIGIPQRLSRDYAEWHVRDFMIRHQVLVGLGDEDIARLGEGRAYEARKPDVQEKIASETNRKQQVRTEVRREVSAEHRAAHGLGAASMVVNTAEGNYAAAGIDAAGMLAENHTVQKTLAQTAVKTGAAEVFEHVAKRIPLIGAGVTVGFVAFAAGKHAWAGDYSLAMGELVAGSTEAAGNIVGFGLGDVAREGTRQGLILAGGDHMAGVEKSGIRQLGEGGYALGKEAYHAIVGQPVSEVLPTSHRSMAPGADEMGNRSEIKRIAVERTGLAANDPRNDIQTLLNENKWRPMGHLLILADGTVQGPEQGAIPFENNPRIAAGKNGETLGVMYAGQGAMNDAQASTFAQVTDSLKQMRTQEGLPKDIEVIAGSTNTAEIMNLPTPRGPLSSAETPQTAPQLQHRQSNSLGGN